MTELILLADIVFDICVVSVLVYLYRRMKVFEDSAQKAISSIGDLSYTLAQDKIAELVIRESQQNDQESTLQH